MALADEAPCCGSTSGGRERDREGVLDSGPVPSDADGLSGSMRSLTRPERTVSADALLGCWGGPRELEEPPLPSEPLCGSTMGAGGKSGEGSVTCTGTGNVAKPGWAFGPGGSGAPSARARSTAAHSHHPSSSGDAPGTFPGGKSADRRWYCACRVRSSGLGVNGQCREASRKTHRECQPQTA